MSQVTEAAVVGAAPEHVILPPLLSAAGWSVLTGVITTLAGLVTSIVVARSLGPILMGEYSYWMWVVAVLPMFFGVGLSQATLKFAAALLAGGQRDLAASLVRALLKIALMIAVTVATGLLLVSVLSASAIQVAICALIAVLIVLGGVTGVLGSAVHAAMDYRFATAVALLLSGGQVILILIALRTGSGVVGLLAAMVASAAVSVLLQARWFMRVYGRGPRHTLPADLRAAIVKYCRSLTGLSVLDAVAWSRSEILFLRLFAGPDQIAFYSLACGISGRLIMAATLITHPMVPALAGLHRLNDARRMSQIYNAAVRYVAVLTFPLVLGGIFFARPLVTLLYGVQYDGVAVPLAITAIASLASALAIACSAALYAIGRPDFLVRVNVFLALADLLASLILIPKYGAIGAALANAIAPMATLIVAAVFLERLYALRFPVWSTIKIFAAASGAVAAAWAMVPADGLPAFVAIGAIAAAGYGAALALGRIFDQEEDRELFAKLGTRLPPALRGYYGRLVSAFI